MMLALPITMPILAMLILAESFRGVASLSTIIKNDAAGVQKMDGVPVLGIVYSATTNSFQSSCLDISIDGTVTD